MTMENTFRIQALPQPKPRRARKRGVNVYALTTPVPIGDDILPILPDEHSRQFVRFVNGGFAYFTTAELSKVAQIENWDVRYVGYAMVWEGEMQLYTNDPSDEAKMTSFRHFEEWCRYAEIRLGAMLNPPPIPEMPKADAQSLAAPMPDLRNFLIALLLIVLFGNVTQIVIAAIR